MASVQAVSYVTVTAGRVLPFAHAARLVRVRDHRQLRPDRWEESQRSYPAAGPAFLRDPFLADAIAYTGVDAEIAGVIRRTAAAVRSNPTLSRLAWHLRFLYYGKTDRRFYRFPVEAPTLGDVAGMLPLLPLLDGVPRMRAIHRKRRIPRRVVTDTLYDLSIWTRHNRKAHGRWGWDEAGWMLLHFSGLLYRLGRLQFCMTDFGGRVHAFRHRDGGPVVLLSAGGVVFRADGRVDGTNGIKDPRGRWTSAFARSGGATRGHPITVTGAALREPVALPAREWREVLKPGDPILDMHIPAGVPLAEAEAVASCDRAPGFFRSRFPAHRFRAIVCSGWLLDAGFQAMLPPTANLLRFQQRFHLFPQRGSDRSPWSHVFGGRPANLRKAPRDTSMRRNMLNFYAAGGRLLGSGGGIWKDHLG